MARMFIEKSESLKFYKYLCQKIGSEEVVRIRRLAFTIKDIGQCAKTITSGSMGEGLNLNGSDFDIMVIDRNFKVFQSETEVQSQCFATPLIMNTEETQSCFTQLCLLSHNIMTVPDVFEKNHRGYMLSSELFKLVYKNFAEVLIPGLNTGNIHGPCISDQDGFLDLAWCLKCDKWIFQAKPWINRPRTTWPSPEIISKIVSSGVQRILSHSGTKVFIPETLNTVILCGIGRQLMGDTFIARQAFQEAADHDEYNFTSAASRLSNLI
ncbi:unnamed protein product [Mytilus coruscus]|uniref:Mab-21-like nucleotidyltransferase domain-containing protein n=1 Tax=Mytilus coruscus TaxID=42192 RepID=A0A6J8ACS7_MYTCO|nr:unnamed protein product [Mytilus coruscus]